MASYSLARSLYVRHIGICTILNSIVVCKFFPEYLYIFLDRYDFHLRAFRITNLLRRIVNWLLFLMEKGKKNRLTENYFSIVFQECSRNEDEFFFLFFFFGSNEWSKIRRGWHRTIKSKLIAFVYDDEREKIGRFFLFILFPRDPRALRSAASSGHCREDFSSSSSSSSSSYHRTIVRRFDRKNGDRVREKWGKERRRICRTTIDRSFFPFGCTYYILLYYFIFVVCARVMKREKKKEKKKKKKKRRAEHRI